MWGNETVVSPSPARGVRRTFIVKAGETWYPGMAVQSDSATNNPFVSTNEGNQPTGLQTGKIYAPGTDGAVAGAVWIVTNDDLKLKGGLITDSYAAGETASVYCPMSGDLLNLLIKNLSGTGDDHAVEEILIVDDATGLFIPDTATPFQKKAKLLQTITDPTADTLALCEWV